MAIFTLVIIIFLIAWAVFGFFLSYNAGKSIGQFQGYIQACDEIRSKITKGE
ncbi:MAG: hypothetical protein ACI4I7_00360 [Oscillospiraceae bacterium]